MRSRSTVLFGSLLTLSLVAAMAPGEVLARTPAPTAKAAKAATGEPEILTRFEAAVPKLGLWPEQKPRIKKLIAEVRASLKKVEASGGTPEQKQLRLQAIHAKAQDGLNHVLTVAQAEKLKKLLSAPPKQKK